jgi:hypothetical protein
MLSSSFVTFDPKPSGCTNSRDFLGAFHPISVSSAPRLAGHFGSTFIVQNDGQDRDFISSGDPINTARNAEKESSISDDLDNKLPLSGTILVFRGQLYA